jgi:hypothetical protein
MIVSVTLTNMITKYWLILSNTYKMIYKYKFTKNDQWAIVKVDTVLPPIASSLAFHLKQK